MGSESTVVVLGRSPEKMRAASAVLETHGFAVVGVFTEADALRVIAGHDSLLAVVAGGSVSAAARERLRAAAAHGVVIVDAAIGHADPAAHFTSEVLPHLIAARTGRAAAHRGGSKLHEGSS
jgi:saccharopine dehydrogenase-like NADP-dependent oxidoreductase